MNSVSRWHHWFPPRYSQEGHRVDPGFVNADAIHPVKIIERQILLNQGANRPINISMVLGSGSQRYQEIAGLKVEVLCKVSIIKYGKDHKY